MATVTCTSGLLSVDWDTLTGRVSAFRANSTNYKSGSLTGNFYHRAPATLPRTNLVVNPSFELDSSTPPANWSTSGGTGGTWTNATVNPSSGSRAMQLVIPVGPFRSPILQNDAITVTPGSVYTISVDVKTALGLGSMQVYYIETLVGGASSQHGVGSSVTGTTGYVTRSTTYVAGPTAASIKFKREVFNGYGSVWLDNFVVTEPFNGASPSQVTSGTAAQSGSDVNVTGVWTGYTLAATFSPHASVTNCIKCSFVATKTGAGDGAEELTFRVPIDGTVGPWSWQGSPDVAPAVITTGSKYSHDNSGVQRVQKSHYPYQSISNGTDCVALGVPMRPECASFYAQSTQGFVVSFNMGFSTGATKFVVATKATYSGSFYIFLSEAAWNQRGAAEIYYGILPDQHTTSLEGGGWTYVLDTYSVPNPKDFGCLYLGTGRSAMPYCVANGLKLMPYTDFQGWFDSIKPYGTAFVGFPGYSPNAPPYAAVVTQTTAKGNGTYVYTNPPETGKDGDGRTNEIDLAAATVIGVPYTEAGLWQIDAAGYFNYGSPFRLKIHPQNVSPELPGGIFSVWDGPPGSHGKGEVDWSKAAGTYVNNFGGLMLDDHSENFGAVENYRASHFPYLNYPLTFSPRTGLPMFCSVWTSFDQMLNWRALMNPDGKGVFPSTTSQMFMLEAAACDGSGWEAQLAGPETLQTTLRRRFAGKGKVLSNFFTQGTPDAPTMTKIANECLAYGIFFGASATYWSVAANYERDRALFKSYMPTVKILHDAGWFPLTRATSSVSTVLLERFGQTASQLFYVTAYNTPTTAAATPTITVAELSTILSVREMITDTAVPFAPTAAGGTFAPTLAIGQSRAYEITIGSGSTVEPVVRTRGHGRDRRRH